MLALTYLNVLLFLQHRHPKHVRTPISMHNDAAMAGRTTVLYSGGGSVSIDILGSGFLGSGHSGSIPLTKAPSGFGGVCSVIVLSGRRNLLIPNVMSLGIT